MRLTSEAYVQKTLTLLNENDVDMEYSASRVRAYIEELYPAVWRRAVEQFPVSWFEPHPYPYDISTRQVIKKTKGIGYVVLPEDFLKLCFFKIKGWKKRANRAFLGDDDVDFKQNNRYTRGTPWRPVCVIRDEPERSMERMLWYYSVPEFSDEVEHKVEEFGYLPEVRALPREQELRPRLVEPLLYLGAVVTLEGLELWESASLLEEKLGRILADGV